ncbi:MAG TPA: glutaredoxin domain-containing protein [Gaiellaceae bacterium]|jgi:glutathione S-transferase
MLELWQTEWCPASRRVRERLTELGVDYVTRQVPVEQKDRKALLAVAGTDSIPALVVEDGSGEAAIGSWLDDHFTEPAGAEAHRLKAAKARRRYLEVCTCLQPVTH